MTILELDELIETGLVTEEKLKDPEFKKRIEEGMKELTDFQNRTFTGTYGEAFQIHERYQELVDVYTSILIQIIVREPPKSCSLLVEEIIDIMKKEE